MKPKRTRDRACFVAAVIDCSMASAPYRRIRSTKTTIKPRGHTTNWLSRRKEFSWCDGALMEIGYRFEAIQGWSGQEDPDASLTVTDTHMAVSPRYVTAIHLICRRSTLI